MSLCEHQLVVALVVGERGRVEGPGCQHLGVGGGHSGRRVSKVIVVEVLSQGSEQVSYRGFGCGVVDFCACCQRTDARVSHGCESLRSGQWSSFWVVFAVIWVSAGGWGTGGCHRPSRGISWKGEGWPSRIGGSRRRG